MTTPTAKIAILMATYNGADCLRAQLDSFATQTVTPALILVSDDGSRDDSRAIVQAFAEDNPALQVELLEGPRKGAAQNFLHLLQSCPPWIDYAALSDQDDVWLDDKLERGLRALQGAEAAAQRSAAPVPEPIPTPAAPPRPRLFCGRSWECDATLGNRRLSRGLRRPASFRHALVQNLAGGNTMMLDRAGLDLLQAASREVRKLVVHDWWIYQLITGVGGEILFDPVPLLLYRQHQGNLIGANRGLVAKRVRLRMLFNGRFRRWNTINIAALRGSAHRLTPENRQVLELFAEERNGPPLQRLSMLRRSGLHRQGLAGQMSLYLAALLRRF
ncbi:glycosyltransferase [Maritimibacter alkaliphilus]|uniref:glycosyltransferase n=1 Tax=Maritimibacter alkaliphilus TaxID=404236 RepID=UPI0028F72330|nr:glycosyltransferase [Maritimibacter alkaliphilus]